MNSDLAEYLPVLVLAVLAVVFVFGSILASRLLAPQRSTNAKLASYECGIVDQSAIPERFPVRFYLVAMLFIMFDIEIVFLYPWAVAHGELALFGFVAMLIFVAIFFLSFVYELAMGGLEWGPRKRRVLPLPLAGRTETGPSEPGPSEPGPSEPGPREPGPSEPGRSEPGCREGGGVRVVGLTGREHLVGDLSQSSGVAAAS